MPILSDLRKKLNLFHSGILDMNPFNLFNPCSTAHQSNLLYLQIPEIIYGFHG